jgi:hypothetical protein
LGLGDGAVGAGAPASGPGLAGAVLPGTRPSLAAPPVIGWLPGGSTGSGLGVRQPRAIAMSAKAAAEVQSTQGVR